MSLARLALAAFLLSSVAAVAAERPREFWRGIVEKDYAVPPGESAAGLIDELSAFLGSADPELRDAFAYSIPSAWIYRDKALTVEQLDRLRTRWQANLSAKVGSTGDDSVFLRSFSALDLSILAAHDNQAPFLTQGQYEDLLGAALGYLSAEKDLRGVDAEKGWMHATAHTADLLKFLGRSTKLTVTDQGRIVDGIAAKLDAAGVGFSHGEHERLARALLSLVVRPDFDSKPLEAWIERTQTGQKALWVEPKLDPVRYDAIQNARLTLRDLYLLVSLQPAEKVTAEVRERLKKAAADL